MSFFIYLSLIHLLIIMVYVPALIPVYPYLSFFYINFVFFLCKSSLEIRISMTIFFFFYHNGLCAFDPIRLPNLILHRIFFSLLQCNQNLSVFVWKKVLHIIFFFLHCVYKFRYSFLCLFFFLCFFLTFYRIF